MLQDHAKKDSKTMSCPASARKSDMVNKTFLLWDGEMDSHIFAASEVGSVLFFLFLFFLIYIILLQN